MYRTLCRPYIETKLQNDPFSVFCDDTKEIFTYVPIQLSAAHSPQTYRKCFSAVGMRHSISLKGNKTVTETACLILRHKERLGNAQVKLN